ncbi:hypothetical protein ACJ72_07561, partial [Emergomyces africanus]
KRIVIEHEDNLIFDLLIAALGHLQYYVHDDIFAATIKDVSHIYTAGTSDYRKGIQLKNQEREVGYTSLPASKVQNMETNYQTDRTTNRLETQSNTKKFSAVVGLMPSTVKLRGSPETQGSVVFAESDAH